MGIFDSLFGKKKGEASTIPVPVLPADTEQTLAARVLTQEHLIYPRAIAHWLAQQGANTA